MAPIRKGDGTGLAAKGFQEVRKGDGTVLWSAGGAIPDSVVHRYDAREIAANDGDAITSWADQEATADLSGNATYQTGIINGNPIARLDAVDDVMDDGGAISLTEPFALFLVGKMRSTGGSKAIYGLDSGNNSRWGGGNGGMWQLSASNGDIDGPSDDTNNHIFGFVYDAAGSELRLDGASEGTGDVTADGFTTNTVSIGDRLAQSIPAPLDAGEVLLVKPTSASDISEVESYLSNGWGITI